MYSWLSEKAFQAALAALSCHRVGRRVQWMLGSRGTFLSCCIHSVILWLAQRTVQPEKAVSSFWRWIMDEQLSLEKQNLNNARFGISLANVLSSRYTTVMNTCSDVRTVWHYYNDDLLPQQFGSIQIKTLVDLQPKEYHIASCISHPTIYLLR